MGSRYIKVVVPGKNLMIKQIRYILLISASILLILLTGCDNSKKAPEPPHAEAALVVELLKALKDKDYILAEKKLTRFEADETTDVYLEDILIRIKNNLLVSKAQKMLNAGEIDKAVECLKQRVSVEGENSSLVGALNDLKTLKELDLLIEKIRNAKNSRELAINTAKLKKAIKAYPPAKILTDYSNKKLNHARIMLAREKELAVEDLKATIDSAWVEGRDYIDSMVAILEVEEPDSNEVLAFKDAMKEDWESEKISDIYLNSEKEFIFFRKGLATTSKQERESLFKELLYLPPSSFKSLLIKAVILKFAGYSTESSTIANQLAGSLSISSLKVRQWFMFIPDSLIDINKINPFVKYPFIIYYDEDLSKN